MKIFLRLSVLFLVILGCGSSQKTPATSSTDFTIAFGSCNNQTYRQPLWDPIIKNDPNLFIWAGDNVYADTDDAEVMKSDYRKQKNNEAYQRLLNRTEVIGTWDDHDYGKNDGGANWYFKEESQQIFLDFFDVPEDSPRRDREGVYHSEIYESEKGSVKVVLLDARYFRSELERSEEEGRRYAPSEGELLGEQQWQWLQEELSNSEADFNIVVSGIQMLSGEHGYEAWANFPNELKKLQDLIVSSEAQNVILLSGDRHISEFSVAEIEGLHYPLMDFTSSGLTHAYEEFPGEPNKYRKGRVVSDLSFGLLKFDFDQEKVRFEMRGENNKLQQDYQINF